MFIKRFTLLDLAEIDQLISTHQQAPHRRMLQNRLAQEVTVLVHGQAEFEHAQKASKILFQGSKEDLAKLDANQLQDLLDGVPRCHLSADVSTQLATDGVDAVSFLSTPHRHFAIKKWSRSIPETK